MSETRRGRISQATYTQVIGRMLTRDWFALDACETLTRLELVDQLVAAYPTRYLTKGAAVRAILDKAIQQVCAACRASSDKQSQRIAEYLEYRQQGETTAAIARRWNLSREYVSRTIGRQAVSLVTERVLVIGRRRGVGGDAGSGTGPVSTLAPNANVRTQQRESA